MEAELVFFALIELTHPWLMLVGLGALIPILIQYWHRQHHPKLDWAATQYLQLALKKVARRFSLLQWLLLALRIAIVLLLAFSVVDPLLKNFSNGFTQSTQIRKLKILVIDNSMSMAAKDRDRSRLDIAKKVASQLADDPVVTDSFMVFTFDRQLSALIPKPIASGNDVLAAIDSIPTTQLAGDGSRLVSDLSNRIRSLDMAAFDQVELHLVSDFVNENWHEESGTTGAWLELLQQVDQIKRHPVAESDLSNNFISSISTPSATSIVNQAQDVVVEVKNIGGGSFQDLNVDLLVDNQLVDNRRIELPSSGRAIARFALTFDKPGEHLIEARIPDDSLDVDNRRFLIQKTRDKYQVLFLEGRPQGSRFLQLALEPRVDSESRIKMDVLSPSQIAAVETESFDAIFLDNIRHLDQAATERVKQFVKSGGLLFMFLGDLVDRPKFNESWNRDGESIQLRLQKLQPVENYQLDLLDYQSRFLKAFQGNPQAALADLPIWVYYQVKAEDDSPWATDIALSTGDPLLMSRRFGRGAMLLFTSSSCSDSRTRPTLEFPEGMSWNANETVAAFPALVQELFSNLKQLPASPSLLTGDFATGRYEVRSRIESYSLIALQGNELSGLELAVDVRQQDNQASWQTAPLKDAGFYRFNSRSGTKNYSRSLAVNVDTKDSDLRLKIPGDTIESFDEADGGTVYSTTGSWHLFQLGLIVLVLFLVAETYCGYRFGKGNG